MKNNPNHMPNNRKKSRDVGKKQNTKTELLEMSYDDTDLLFDFENREEIMAAKLTAPTALLTWCSYFVHRVLNENEMHDMIRREGKKVGYLALSGLGAADGILHLDNILVVPEAQKKGIGSQVLTMIENFARRNGYSTVSLQVWEPAGESCAFFRKRGYVDVEIVDAIAPNGMPAHRIYMEKALNAPLRLNTQTDLESTEE